MEIGERSKYAWRHMFGTKISPSGRMSIKRKHGLGVARCFSGDDDRVECPWPYDVEGNENPVYGDVVMDCRHTAPSRISGIRVQTMSYSVVDDPDGWSVDDDQNQTH